MRPGPILLIFAIVLGGCSRVGFVRPSLAPAPPDAPAAPPALVVVPATRDSGRADSLAAVASLAAAIDLDSLLGVAPGDSVLDVAAIDNLPVLAVEPYANHERVEHYVRVFAGDAKDRIGERLSRGTRYDETIRAKLRAAGIPEDFVYLALIESGYDPHAYSPAAAVGMWQFMTSTARGVGMRVDWWIDERRDPLRATDGAISYLNQLREQFGSYYLAAAAYNGGPGRVSRGLSRLAEEVEGAEPEDRFFTLASTNLLRVETRNYVPQLIAATIIGRDPTAYEIVVDTQPEFTYDSVWVAPATGLPAIARACGVDARDVVEMNGHVLRGMTPPTGPGLSVRVPSGCAAFFGDAFAGIDSGARSGAVRHVVKKGETPSSLARTAGITLTVLRRYNPGLPTSSGGSVRVGSVVLIPKAETVRASREVPDPAIERYGAAAGGTYTVRRGDTLSGIALRNRTSVATLKRLNRLSSDKIYVGQKLRVR